MHLFCISRAPQSSEIVKREGSGHRSPGGPPMGASRPPVASHWLDGDHFKCHGLGSAHDPFAAWPQRLGGPAILKGSRGPAPAAVVKGSPACNDPQLVTVANIEIAYIRGSCASIAHGLVFWID
jgi:hypothetical protein